MGSIGAPELLILLGPISLGVTIWALVDAARRPRPLWDGAGQSQTLWVVLLCIGIPFCGPGLVVALVYLLAIRPRLQQVDGPPRY